MESSVEIGLMEFERAREEIDKRTELSANLINYEIILVGILLSASATIPKEALVVGACVSCLFWLMWIDHTSQIYKIAAYVGIQLAPRLRAVDPKALGWELFLRKLDEGDASALFGGRDDTRLPFLQTAGINRYILLLFLGGALALAFAYLAAVQGDRWRSTWLVFPAALLVYSLFRSRQLTQTGRLVARAIIHSEPADPAPGGSGTRTDGFARSAD